MKKSVIFVFILFSLLVLQSRNQLRENSTDYFKDKFPQKNLSLVYKQFGCFLDKIQTGSEGDYGLLNSDEIGKALLDPPYRLYYIKPEAIINFKSNHSIIDLTAKTSLWYFPVVIDDDYRAFLVVEEKDDETFNAVSFGYARLAKDIEIAISKKVWVKNETNLLVSYQAKEFFGASPLVVPLKLFQLQYDFDSKPKPIDDLDIQVNRIRAIVENNLYEGK